MKLKETIKKTKEAYDDALQKREYYRAEVYKLEGALRAYQSMLSDEGCPDCAKPKITKKNGKQ